MRIRPDHVAPPVGPAAAALTPADRVTLARGGLLVVVAGLVLARGALDPVGWAWAVLVLAVPMLALDAVDGAVARRTVATARGARWDMETDAAAVAVLSVAAAPVVGWWVLLAGALRYVFVLAGRVVPGLRGPLPPSQARRVVAAVQGPALLSAVVPGLPVPVPVTACAVALAALLWSFGRDTVVLGRARPPGGAHLAWAGMKALIVTLLAVWLVVAVLGVVLEGLFWLLVVGLVLFVATAVWGWFKLRAVVARD